MGLPQKVAPNSSRLTSIGPSPAVYTLEWNWEIPTEDDNPRARRFPRRELAAQASAALLRLRHVHTALVQEIGIDLRNQPPAAGYLDKILAKIVSHMERRNGHSAYLVAAHDPFLHLTADVLILLQGHSDFLQ
jgi:hypothetical protein